MLSIWVLTVFECNDIAGGDADPAENYQHMQEYYMVSLAQQRPVPSGFDPAAAAERFCEFTFAGLAATASAEIPPPGPIIVGAAGAIIGSQVCPAIVKGIQNGVQTGIQAMNRK